MHYTFWRAVEETDEKLRSGFWGIIVVVWVRGLFHGGSSIHCRTPIRTEHFSLVKHYLSWTSGWEKNPFVLFVWPELAVLFIDVVVWLVKHAGFLAPG